jgi:elongator complex protein 3
MNRKEEALRELLQLIEQNKIKTQYNLNKLKIKISKKYNLRKILTNIEIFLSVSENAIKKYRCLFITKPTRTISGVAVIAIMSKPELCPHAKKGKGPCIVCPGGPASIFGDVPQSYTGKEPATMRALRNKFDPYLQVMNRLEHYIVMGHSPEKVELIVMGGTFPSFKKSYQENFIRNCFKAMNDFSDLFYRKGKFDFVNAQKSKISGTQKSFDFLRFKKFFELPGKVDDPLRAKHIHAKLKKLKQKAKKNLESEQKRNEKSSIRCVGLTLETRPDYAKLKQGNEMLRLGCTRVELGVQSVYDSALKKIQRGHSVKDTIESISVLKDLGFKINAHYMLGLPGISKKKDLEGLKELFSNSDFKPDMLKLYPTMVVEGTKLYGLWKKKRYNPLATKQAAEIISEAKKFIPKYVRIMRVQRDIPTYMTAAGVDRTNLRQYVAELTRKKKIKCKCIRCREIGRAEKIGKPEIDMIHYPASGGTEFFIFAEDKYNSLFGFCRLRFPNKALRKEITEDSALVRELHVYGPAAAIGKKGKVQHKGIGKKLLKKAEDIAKTYNKEKIIIISGIGVKNYYKKFGYKEEGPYMVKKV